MSRNTPETLLETAIRENRTGLNGAFRALYSSERSPPDLVSFEFVIGKDPRQLAVRILKMIDDEGLMKRFVAVLSRFNIILRPVKAKKASDLIDLESANGTLGDVALEGAVDAADYDKDHTIPRKFLTFLGRASNFRCRITVDGKIKGSGVLVSPRLVLTAWHVISAKSEKEPRDNRRIEILDSEGRTHPVQIDYFSSCHEDEWSGGIPKAKFADKHHDTLLLRIAEPIGHLLGYVDLLAEPLTWKDKSTFALVHFPKGEDRGVGLGKISRNTGAEVRVTHELTTAGGSSGGACFNLAGEFLGLHQGRLGKLKRLVPYDRFAKDAEFRSSLKRDRDPPYLWSLNNSLDGHLIVGRNKLFAAADAMKGDNHTNIRGLWVQRTSLETDSGLSFTYDILDRFLDPQKHRLIRISADLSTKDFIHHAATATGNSEALDQVAVGDDASRVRSLAVWLNETAKNEHKKFWLFIDNPTAGLTSQIQSQLGQFVVETIRHPWLRTVLTGCETYRLDVDIFATAEMAARALAPGLLREFIGRFDRRDLRQTLNRIGKDIGMRWGGERREEAAHRVLDPFEAVAGNHYSMKDMADVAKGIKSEVDLRHRFENGSFL